MSASPLVSLGVLRRLIRVVEWSAWPIEGLRVREAEMLGSLVEVREGKDRYAPLKAYQFAKQSCLDRSVACWMVWERRVKELRGSD